MKKLLALAIIVGVAGSFAFFGSVQNATGQDLVELRVSDTDIIGRANIQTFTLDGRAVSAFMDGHKARYDIEVHCAACPKGAPWCMFIPNCTPRTTEVSITRTSDEVELMACDQLLAEECIIF